MFPARRRDRPIESQVSPRAAWYDRNPIILAANTTILTAAPHGFTERWAYTVPTGKKAYVEFVSGFVVRITAATTVGVAKSVFAITPYGQTKIQLIFAEIYTNGAYDRERINVPCNITLITGDAISFNTQDGSTGGTVTYMGTSKITEFDG